MLSGYDEKTCRLIGEIVNICVDERILDENAIKRVAKEIIENRMIDFEYILENNINEIIAEAKKGRE